MKTTQYFQTMRLRPDRAGIDMEWIRRTIEHPDRETIQDDGRIRRYKAIPEAGGKYLRAILLADGETVHNAFFDRGFQKGDDVEAEGLQFDPGDTVAKSATPVLALH